MQNYSPQKDHWDDIEQQWNNPDIYNIMRIITPLATTYLF